MADIQSKILGKYGIDIAQENIFKLYKLESADISPQELETKIQETRKRWETSVNGANEKNAQRDRARLEKADQYERVLKDAKLREQVSAYYNNPKSAEEAGNSSGSTEFAKEYFALIGTTKKIKRADVDFFFNYYSSERKNRKAITEMLEKDFKVKGISKKEAAGDEDEEEFTGKKKDNNSPLIVNLFQEATILKIKKAVEHYEKAQGSEELCTRYPKLREGLYEFLELENTDNAESFSKLTFDKGQEVYAVRQEKGMEYVPLVDLFNTLKEVGTYQDVVDNFSEFKLLLKYPKLTPYMFAFVEVKPSTVKGIVKVANRDYAFRDDTDFILNYYRLIYDNFGINNRGIHSIVQKAEKKAKQNKILNEIDEKLGRTKKKRNYSIGIELIHWLVYWPIFMTYFVFEAAKVVFTKLQGLVIPTFVAFFILCNWMFPKFLDIDNMLVFRKIIFKDQWYPFLDDFVGIVPGNGLETILFSLFAIVFLSAIYIGPSVLAAMAVSEFADDFNKRFDWFGYERTFQNILQRLKKKTEEQYASQKGLFVRNKVPKIITNILCVVLILVMVWVTPGIMEKLSEATGYGQDETVQEAFAENGSGKEAESAEAEETESSAKPQGGIMRINAEAANIRSGPGTEYDIVAGAALGDSFVATGNQENASNGRIWYEIYLDDEMTKTGWASEKVIESQN